MAPLIKELARYPEEITCLVAVTAQHREMLDQVLDLFVIRPDYDLNIMKSGQSLFEITCRALSGLREILNKERPDLTLVHGDTTTTFVSALAAYYLQIPVGHVEAGLRTGDKYAPFPEEINRRLTAGIADLHFAPTSLARDNLLKEGVSREKIFVTGNTVIDALFLTLKDNYRFNNSALNGIDYKNRRIILVTTHRRENFGGPMKSVYRALNTIVDSYQDVEFIFPVHRNPIVRNAVDELLSGLDRVHLVDPLEYEPFINLMSRSYLVLTDSGGLQEEAPALGKPVLVLRDVTERPEAVWAGTVRIIGTQYEKVVSEVRQLLDDQQHYKRMSEAVNPYGDGKASERICQAILYYYGYNKKPFSEYCAR
ncbi:MAG TPA: UDP-N-acetylglucosamine 2-epimerase (non-hydrolyzing) [Desulfotomaculum sp.]|nr:UDP-N-acetylglucosamine 2-epimerase (non-hydrolyzing) [Desulfotomaculum sp.]HBY04894.1 UDP-N-acetylglucosamine 2-epimerase (non-hydrolyzing) [Desulfotomaculum sp.]